MEGSAYPNPAKRQPINPLPIPNRVYIKIHNQNFMYKFCKNLTFQNVTDRLDLLAGRGGKGKPRCEVGLRALEVERGLPPPSQLLLARLQVDTWWIRGG